MRALILALASLVLPAQATLDVAPAQPRVDGVTTFTLSGVTPLRATWDFGDRTQPQEGGAVTTHAYAAPGTFLVRCTYLLNATTGITASVQRSVRVVEPRRIVLSPAAPEPGQPVTFRALNFFNERDVSWSFGDDTSAPGATATHTYARKGTYTVTVWDRVAGTNGRSFQTRVTVGNTGPGAAFSLSYLALRWEDGTAYKTVTQGEEVLMAFADLKHEGAGLLQAQWMVDGVPFRTLTRQLAFAGRATLSSGQDLPGAPRMSFPTNIPGEHRVTLRVTSPTLAFEVPVLRYFVRLGSDPEGPSARSVFPSRTRAGEEVELQLTGDRFVAGMVPELGRDVAVVGPLRVLSPQTAVVKVFVAPSARPGSRIVRVARPGGGPGGTARITILAPTKKLSASK